MLNRENVLVFLVALLALIAMSACAVLKVRLYQKMAGFEWFVANVLWPVCLVVASWPAVVVLHFLPRITGNPKLVFITPEQWRFSKLKLLIFALLASLLNLLTGLPAPFLPGPLQVILNQLVVPGTMICSFLFFRSRYGWTHIVGALIVLTGVALAVVPDLISHTTNHTATSDSNSDDHPISPPHRYFGMWISLYIAGQVSFGNIIGLFNVLFHFTSDVLALGPIFSSPTSFLPSFLSRYQPDR